MTYDKILRNTIIAGAFLVPFIPLIVANSMFFPFITGKNFTFRIIVEIIFALWAILALRNVEFRPRFSWIFVSLSAFVGIIFFADMFGANADKSIWSNFERMEGWVTLAHLWMYFVVLGSVFKSKELWAWFFHISIGISLYSILFGLFQLDGLATINQGGVRVDGKFGNATYLAVYMLFHIFITGWYLFNKQTNATKLLTGLLVGSGIFAFEVMARASAQNAPEGISLFVWGTLGLIALLVVTFVQRKSDYVQKYIIPSIYSIVILLQLLILFYTATRGTILGVLGGIFLTGILIAIVERERPVLRKVAAGLIIGVIAVVGTFFIFEDSQFVQENQTLKRFAKISLDSGTVGHRFAIWSMAWEGIQERPILGWGQENFNLIFNEYYEPELYAAEPWFDRVHNIVLDWLVAGGFLGFLAYAAIPIVLLVYIWRAPLSTFSRTEKCLFTGMIAAYGFHNMFVFDNIVSYIFYATILAYVYAMVSGERKEDSVFSKEIDSGFVDRLATPVIIIALIFGVYFVNVKSILANMTLIDALRQQSSPSENISLFREALAYNAPIGTQEIREQLIQSASLAGRADIPIEIKQELLTLAVSEMEQHIEENPGDARLHLFLGSLLEGYGQFEAAQEHFARAQELSPEKQSVRFTLAGNYLNTGETEKALELLEETAQLAPEYREGHIMHAVAAIYNGDDELAEQILNEELGSTTVDSSRLIQAYANTDQYDKVADIWKLRVEKNPNNTQNRLSLAASYLQLEERQSAIAEIEKVIELDPSFQEQGEYLINEIRAGRNP